MNALLQSLRPLLLAALVLLAVLTLSRPALVALYRERVAAVDAIGFDFAQGFRFDLVIIGMLIVLPLLLLPLFATSAAGLSVWRTLPSVYLPLALIAVVLTELATPSFVDQFDTRPNVLTESYRTGSDGVHPPAAPDPLAPISMNVGAPSANPQTDP